MSDEEHNIQRKIQHLQSMLGEINRYLQGAASKPSATISRLLEEKGKLTVQLRELNNMCIDKNSEVPKPNKIASSIYSPGMASSMERIKESFTYQHPMQDPMDKMLDLEDLLKEMGLEAEIDESSRRLIFTGADMFLDQVLSTACFIARNNNQEHLTEDNILLAMKVEKGLDMNNTAIYSKAREPNKAHLKRMQMIKRDQKKAI
ncbi:hypothetical protein NEOKW01_0141 [Nematocida sp. AWRm80]|nr:hypothetical protein NEOKW01_0141 [Nematocida sp. AWRm80]